jgi:polyhydroxyalkanoate synthesis regulator phasin
MVVISVGVALGACDSGREEVVQEHVWQGQVNALEQAKGVEDMVKDAAERQRQQVDEAVGKMRQQ